jgi:riboflavin kinase/FMN adenylyltransferase
VRVVHGLGAVPPEARPSCATVGVFDGVHLGHQALLGRLVERARERGATATVVTFDRHPQELINPAEAPPLITTLRQRAAVFERVGIDLVVVLRFDESLRRLEPEAFVRQVLVDSLGVVHVVVGANFRFGHRGAGTVEDLRRLGEALGFTVEVFELVQDEAPGEPVSSSLIRRQLAEGDVERVTRELGRPFQLEGRVVAGAGRGRDLGVPTANLDVPPKLCLPRIGVYAGWVTHQGVRRPAVINVGLNPTFEVRDRPVVEAHVLDFEGELHGRVITVEFTHRLRDERRFPDAAALVAEIRRDIARARELLGVPEPGAGPARAAGRRGRRAR